MSQRITPPYLALGEITRPHGVRGELRVRLLTDFPERLPTLEHIFIGADPAKPDARRYEIESVRLIIDHALIKLRGIDDRNDIEAWRGLLIMIDTANAVPLEEDEYYTYEMIGLTVITETGHVLGTIKDIMETGANDVMIVTSPEFGEILIPDAPGVWLNLDFEGGFATVQLPEGLLPT